MTQKQVGDEMNRFVLNPQTNEWDYDDSRIPQQFMAYVNRNRSGKYQSPKRLFKQIFFDDIKEAFFAQIQGHDRIDTRTKAVINNAALAAMYKLLIVNEGFRRNNIDPNDITSVNKWKKTPEFTNILLGLLTEIHNYSHEDADGLVNAAAQIYQEVANRVLTNQATAAEQRGIRSQQRNELYERRIGQMRGNQAIQQLNFGARQVHNYSPSKRNQRQRPRAPPDQPHTPDPDTPPPNNE